jgi:hypothetical protein
MALKHWTNASVDDFAHKVASDFVYQIEQSLGDTKQSEFAAKLGVSPASVSQVLNKPGNIGLRKMVEYALRLGKKLAVVIYDDGDSLNERGPINSQVFAECWKRDGEPHDFFELDAGASTQTTYVLTPVSHVMNLAIKPHGKATNDAMQPLGIQTSAGTTGVNIAGVQ